ncbi:hypothetical protein L218DRAFT_955103 [Marasmius fiardii PR-910]|nr:hypothetical protein L218DRAFT_955103 [Marasmius fiardii PR-910]
MSFFLGLVSGTLFAGGVYYGFSDMIHERLKQLSTDLHTQSVHLAETPTLVQAPPSAASRIPEKQFLDMVQTKWNDQVEGLYKWCQDVDRRVLDWGQKTVYGSPSLPENKGSR